MARRAEGLEVGPIPEAMIRSLVLDDVVDLEPPLHHTTHGAFVGLVGEHLLPDLLPPHGVVRPAMMSVRRAVATHDERRTPRLCAILHLLGA